MQEERGKKKEVRHTPSAVQVNNKYFNNLIFQIELLQFK